MSPESAERLTQLTLSSTPEPELRAARIGDSLLARSRHITQPGFTRISTDDLRFLFEAYDREFFDGLCRAALNGRRLSFRLVSRLSKSAGVTRRIHHTRTGETTFDIGIATTILFDGFGPADPIRDVCGLPCPTRLVALQRIFEHELVHLIENLCWERTNCAAERFQGIAARHFGHRSHTHNLITRRERAAEIGIRTGTQVTFTFEGRTLTGFVNRITHRATVLVEDPQGQRYSNGRRYLKYYVPLECCVANSIGCGSGDRG